MRTFLTAMTLFGLGLVLTARADSGAGPAAVPPAAESFRIGTIKLWSLHDADNAVPNDGKIFGVDAGPAAVGDVLRSAGAPTDRITVSVNALLVQTKDRLLLLDTGLGPKVHGALLASLGAAGASASAVTDVLITHSHGDHVGGLLDADGRFAFPNATVRMASAEWAWMQKQGSASLVKAIADRVRTFEPGTEIAPGVKSVALDGHTPGHVGYEIASGHSHLLDVGDLVHSSIVSLAKPQWTMGFDSEPAIAKATRMSTLSTLAKDREFIFSPHFPFPGVGRIAVRGDGFAWEPGLP